MRAHGVPNFPDPGPNGNFAFGTNGPPSPAMHGALAKCERYAPLGPLSTGSPPSRRTMAKLLRIARCMRAHGVHQFPDPLYSRPAHITPGAYRVITNFDGALLLFPMSLNLQAPAYRQALSACGAPPLGLPH
jgi:hypothetical protein